jgi:hypothetical protein
MRSIGWIVLLAVVLLAAQQRVPGTAPPPQPPKAAAPARVAEKRDDVVDGYGPNPAKAQEVALGHAQERVEKLLARRLGKGLQLPADQLDPDFLLSQGVAEPLGKPELTKNRNVEGAWVARYKVELTRDYLGEVVRLANAQRVRQRHLLLARVLAGLVALALVTAGYLRLEDATRGYATKLLRLAAAVLLALAVGVLLVIG